LEVILFEIDTAPLIAKHIFITDDKLKQPVKLKPI